MASAYRSRCWEEAREGEELPALERDITATLVAVGAISATRDFYPVHHDAAFARQSGAEDIFMNILTSNGIVGKFLTDWSGPEGELRRITIRLMVPNYPGDRMRLAGKVVRKFTAGTDHLVEIAFEATNSRGPHVQGTAVLALPSRG